MFDPGHIFLFFFLAVLGLCCGTWATLITVVNFLVACAGFVALWHVGS